MLLTEWGEKLDKKNPLPEYPRPQFVRNSFFNLNGMWKCNFTSNGKIPSDFPIDICVPFSPETPLSGVNRVLTPGEYIHYEKHFTLPENFNVGRVFLHFGAVDQIASVCLNGEKLGEHHGGFTPFSFEITDYLLKGENTLIVSCCDYSEQNSYSRGKQRFNRGGIWYSPQSGIWQTVWLESTPDEYIKNVRITPDYDKSTVSFEFEGCDYAEIYIYDDGDLIAQTKEKTVYIDNFKPWSPENPFLYDVMFVFNKDRVKSYFGMRKFSVEKDSNGVLRLFLNNKPYFHNGLLDQGYYPDGYLTPPSNDAMEFDVKTVKEWGFNMLRKHIKIEPLLWYHYCDVNGIIVWQDMINGGGNYGAEVSVFPFIGINLDDRNYKTFKRTDEKARALYYEELECMVKHLYNCPCIAIWVPFNEGWGQFDSKKAYELLKKLDSTRLVDTTSGWHDRGSSDFISKHIYFTPIRVKQYNKPYLLSEFGGLGLRIKGHTFNDKMFGYKVYKSTASLTKGYKKLFEKTIIPQITDGLSATVYTQVTDVEDELNGIMTYDRRVQKIPHRVMNEINKQMKIKE